MELKYLGTFRTVAEEGSFGRAAEKLHYTQSTITFQMGRLEAELGVRLFERVGRRMALTKAGEALLPYADQVMEAVERLRGFQADLDRCRGTLRVGAGETLLCYRLPPALKAFHSQAPLARLVLRSMSCCDIRDALLDGSLDVGVFYAEVGGFGAGIDVLPLWECPLVLVASPGVGAACPDFLTPDRHLPVPFLINEPTCIFRRMFEAYLRERSITLDHTVELWSIPTILNLVKNDVGVSFLPRFAAAEALERGELVELPTAMEAPCITAVCGVHRGKWVSPLMRRFLDLCGQAAEQM